MERYKGKTGGLCKIWRDEAERDLKTRGIINRQAVVRDHWELRKTVLETNFHKRV